MMLQFSMHQVVPANGANEADPPPLSSDPALLLHATKDRSAQLSMAKTKILKFFGHKKSPRIAPGGNVLLKDA